MSDLAAADRVAAAQTSFRVLVVDDDPDMVVFFARLLASESMAVDTAHDGETALAHIAARAPDLVLLDVVMPGVSGFEVCERLKADPATALIPVILVTALEDHASRVRGIEAGADDFLSKPVNREELIARVKTLRRLHQTRRELEGRRLAAEVRRKEAVRRTFSRYLSPRLAEQIMDDLGNEAAAFKVDARRASVVALFADLRGFTRITESIEVDHVVGMLYEYFSVLTEVAYENDGKLAWRGEIARQYRGDVYPTHGLGPVSLWMGINRGDRYTTIVSMDTGTKGLQSYARERWGKDHPAAQPGYFQKGDTTITMLRSANDKLVVVRYESGSTRPAGGWECLNGTKGSYDGSPGAEQLYLEGRSPRERWEPLSKYGDEFDHPFWRADGETASRTGHGGGDYFVMREFYRAVMENREPPIDVYDGATWSAVLPLSGKSIRESNKSLEMPDFTRGKWKERKLTGFGISKQQGGV